jgi:serine/threonine-protein kinase
MPLTSGENFGGFRIVRLLGSGGMGEVYLAEHPRLPRRVALKVLPGDVSADPEYRARFNREADLASTLWHPHIVSVHDRGEYNGQLWISMDYVDGLDAARLLAGRFPAGMPTHQVLRIITAVASALDYAHKQGLLHRDVKPANIMLTHLDDDEDEQRVLLADFGIARNVDDIRGLTATNMTLGTVAYSAPEQLMGEDIDGRADQYALAATGYQLLTGSPLFADSNPAVVISLHSTRLHLRCRNIAPIWPTSMRSWRQRCPRSPPTAIYGARTSPGPWPITPAHSPSPHRQHPRPKPRCAARQPLSHGPSRRLSRRRSNKPDRGAGG